MKHLAAVLVASCLLVSSACGGGGGGDGTSSGLDLGGWWLETVRPAGSGLPYESFDLVNTQQTGSSVWLEGSEGTILSTDVKWALPDGTAPNRKELSLTIVDGDHLEGGMQVYVGGTVVQDLDLRMERRVAPAGWLTADGTVDGNALTIDTHTAYATLFAGRGAWNATLVRSTPTERTEVVLDFLSGVSFEPEPGVAYAVSAGPLAIGIDVHTGWADASAADGGILFTAVESGRLAGAYGAELPSGETVTGQLDVPVLIVR